MAEEERTQVFYESPHKLLKTLGQMIPLFGAQRHLVVIRELTKRYETHFRGPLQDAIVYFEGHPPKGEFVIVIEGNKR